MKRAIFSFLLLIPVFSFGQKLDGCWGLKFYAGQAHVKSEISSKTGRDPETKSNENLLYYKDCEFAGRHAQEILLLFFNDSLYGMEVVFVPGKEPDILNLYSNIKDELVRKYWFPQLEAERYEYPFEKGDKYYLTAIQGGYVTIGSIWYFPRQGKENVDGEIMLNVKDTLRIKLTYRDGLLSKRILEMIEKEKESDY
ncbi:MAG TPA: hypothetical protein VEB40_12105 [Flavipsychrobacter sp.]|nr:hypothetical protein [Flavipsychrobacter sp.]